MIAFKKAGELLAILKEAQGNGVAVRVEAPIKDRRNITVSNGDPELTDTLLGYAYELELLSEYYGLLNKPLLKREADRLRMIATRFGFTLEWEQKCFNDPCNPFHVDTGDLGEKPTYNPRLFGKRIRKRAA